MKDEEKIHIYKETMKKYGMHNQMLMLMEECAELIHATNQIIRKGPIDKKKALYNFSEEIADVEIMIEQLVLLRKIRDDVNKIKEEKLTRLKKRNNIK